VTGAALPERMRVARLHAWGDVRIEDVPVPRPGPGEIIVRIEACGVCGSDALVWYVERKAPVVLGHEPAGVVAAVGAGVAGVREGDRVFVHHHAPCGRCAECRRALWSNCAAWKAGQLEPGGFAEYVRVGAGSVAQDTLRLPDALSMDEATFIEPVACCVRALRRQGRLEPGDAVLVVGLGAMGQVLVQLARSHGAAIVLGTDFLEPRRALALRQGADAAFDPAAGGTAAAVRAATGGRGADVVVVTPGTEAAIAAGIDAAAPGARVVCFTPLPADRRLHVPAGSLYFREVTLTHSYSCGPDETRAALELLTDGRLDVAPLVTHRTGLDGVAAALERARGKGDGLKTIIHPHA
jgi:L-iditol 2-dehydrogenase